MLHIEYIKHLSALIDNPVFFAFFLVVLIDVMTGFVKSLINKETTSSKGISGLIKHSTLLLVVCVLYPLCDIYGASGMADTLLILYPFLRDFDYRKSGSDGNPDSRMA